MPLDHRSSHGTRSQSMSWQEQQLEKSTIIPASSGSQVLPSTGSYQLDGHRKVAQCSHSLLTHLSPLWDHFNLLNTVHFLCRPLVLVLLNAPNRSSNGPTMDTNGSADRVSSRIKFLWGSLVLRVDMWGWVPVMITTGVWRNVQLYVFVLHSGLY